MTAQGSNVTYPGQPAGPLASAAEYFEAGSELPVSFDQVNQNAPSATIWNGTDPVPDHGGLFQHLQPELPRGLPTSDTLRRADDAPKTDTAQHDPPHMSSFYPVSAPEEWGNFPGEGTLPALALSHNMAPPVDDWQSILLPSASGPNDEAASNEDTSRGQANQPSGAFNFGPVLGKLTRPHGCNLLCR